MKRLPSVCIVVPCFNEGSRLHFPSFKEALAKMENLHLLFVNDGSTDSTQTQLETFVDQLEQVRVIVLPINQGKGEAVRSGVLHASKWQEFDYIGYFDADLSTPLTELPKMWQLLEKSPQLLIVFGSRIKRMGALVQRNEVRHYVGRIFATMASMLLKLPIYDTQCGAKLFKPSLIPVVFQHTFLSKWLFDVELTARMIREYGRVEMRERLIEYPLETWIEKGASKIKLLDIFTVPFQLIRIYYRYFKK